eukprot:tig00000532_g1893.t1
MGKEWIPAEGKLDLGGKDREEWPAAEIAAAGPENIRWLELWGNELTSIPGAELAKLTNLEWLWLSNNRLTALPPEIGRLTALRWLNVQGNQLTALPPEIGRLAALQELYVSNNQLMALPPEIGRLSSLQELLVSSNQLTVLPPEIGRLSSLQKLSVEKNQLAALPPEIGRLSRLQTLDVSGNPSERLNASDPSAPSPPRPAVCPAAPPQPAPPTRAPPPRPPPTSAGHLALALKLQLEQAGPGLRVFLDADDSRLELHQLENIIDASASVVLIISQDVLASHYVLGEVRHAARAGKNIVLLHDEKSCRFPAPGEIPSDLRLVFARKAIPYYAEATFRRVSLRLLLEACDEGARR